MFLFGHLRVWKTILFVRKTDNIIVFIISWPTNPADNSCSSEMFPRKFVTSASVQKTTGPPHVSRGRVIIRLWITVFFLSNYAALLKRLGVHAMTYTYLFYIRSVSVDADTPLDYVHYEFFCGRFGTLLSFSKEHECIHKL